MTVDRRVLPAPAKHLLEQLAAALHVEQLRLFGGAALDLLIDPSVPCHDVDVALPAGDFEAFDPSAEVEIVGQPRSYWICHSIPVVITTARWKGTVLDLNFLDEMGKIGHFDIERVYWDFPDCLFTDLHDVTLKPVRTFQLVTTPDSENPVLLLNRVVKLAAKYNIPFWLQWHLLDFVEQLVAATADSMPADNFHGPEAHAAHLRAIASSVRRAARPRDFLHGCLQAGVLDARLGSLANALRRDPSAQTRLAGASSDDLFWRTADDLVADGGAGWRQYRRENRCGSVS